MHGIWKAGAGSDPNVFVEIAAFLLQNGVGRLSMSREDVVKRFAAGHLKPCDLFTRCSHISMTSKIASVPLATWAATQL
jgi:hypothetical protein